MVKQDLAEFVSTIQQDTSTVVADTATAVKESLKVHLQHLLIFWHINHTLQVEEQLAKQYICMIFYKLVTSSWAV